jgi:hypothetical protein
MGKRNRDVCMKERYKPFKFEELRKNPEMNPHIGAWDYVDKYKDDDDVYISFTEIDKIGINPQSKFNTPVGIYTYPLKQFYKLYLKPALNLDNIRNRDTVGQYAPFAGNSKYVNFIRCKNKANFIEDMYRDYGSNDYDRDIKILEKNYIIPQVHNINELAQKTTNYFLEEFRWDPWHLQTFLEYSKYDLSYDICNKLIIKLENQKDPKIIYKEVFSLLNKFNNKFNLILEEGIETAKEKNPIMMMWNITRLLAEKLSNNAKQASTKWNIILSKDLGYSGFADKSGKGYIHPSEPMQAVFFNTRAFEVIARLENIPAKNLAKSRPPKLQAGVKFKNNKNNQIYIITKYSSAADRVYYHNILDKGDEWERDAIKFLDQFNTGEWTVIK